MAPELEEIERRLLLAHEANDSRQLVQLYTEAANYLETVKNIDATCFYLTHAFVYALELGLSEAAGLNKRLVAYGRAHPIPNDV